MRAGRKMLISSRNMFTLKTSPGGKKKDKTNRKLLNEFRAPPHRLFTLLHELHSTVYARTHTARVPTHGSDGEVCLTSIYLVSPANSK